MVMTVPRLAIDELEPMVDPDPFMQDDGCARTFAKLFIYDNMPRMRVSDEVLDLMCLAEPSVTELVLEGSVPDDFQDVADDGLEAAWAEELFRTVTVEAIHETPAEVPYEVADGACEAFASLMATGAGFAAQPDWARLSELVCESDEVEDVPVDPGVPFEVTEEACSSFASLMATEVGFEVQPDWVEVSDLVCESDEVEDVSTVDQGWTFDLPEDCGPVSEFISMGDAAPEAPSVPAHPIPTPVVEAVPMIATAAPVQALPASSAPTGIAAPVPQVMQAIQAAPVKAMIGAAVGAMTLPAPVVDDGRTEASLPVEVATEREVAERGPLVTFSFGPERVRESGWRVTFTF